jgi:hypothetical protein
VLNTGLTRGPTRKKRGDDAVWRLMRKHDLHLDRRQSCCVSTDPEFSRKASEIVGLYLNPPENAIVLSVDEKPSIQALERAQGYIRLPNGRAVSGLCSRKQRAWHDDAFRGARNRHPIIAGCRKPGHLPVAEPRPE